MTTSDRPSERGIPFGERLRPRNWSLTVKLIVVFLVPTLLALGLGGLRILDQLRAGEILGQTERYVELQDNVTALVGQLQRERDQSSVFVALERRGDLPALKKQFEAVDGAAAEVRRSAADIGAATLPPALAAADKPAQDALNKITALRAQVTEAAPIAPGEVTKQYTGIVAPVLSLETALARQMQSPGLVELSGGLVALAAIQEQIAEQHAVIAVGIADNKLAPADLEVVRTADTRLVVAIDDIKATLTPEQQAKFAGFLTSPNFTQFQQLKQGIVGRAAANLPPGVLAADWDGSYGRVLTDLGSADNTMRGDVRTISAAAQETARNQAIINGAILLFAILLGTIIVVLVARTLRRSLRTLRRTAMDVAERRLPQAVESMRSGEVPDITIQPVPVTSHEEIGQVARAFDAVHSQAVRLAAEQATLQTNVSSMFVNLSRRSQGLVERQLQLIEQLESNEQDPDQLSNLFQLDHLATRMRRNSENLLVLAGSEMARRGGQPVPVVDVLRAAVSEVEQYQRIVVQPPPAVKVLGRAASDVVHLIAELLDNATIYSAPESQVVMTSHRTDDGAVLIEIADRGIGMSAEDLAEANHRLNGPLTVDVSAARRMGLFVVGRLAARHSITVHLAGSAGSGPGAGVTASVSVPNYLVSRGDSDISDTPGGTDTAYGRTAGDRLVSVPPQRPPANGAARAGSFSAVVANAESPGRPSNGVANGHGPARSDFGRPPAGPAEGIPSAHPQPAAPTGGGQPGAAQPSGGPGGGFRPAVPPAAGAPGAPGLGQPGSSPFGAQPSQPSARPPGGPAVGAPAGAPAAPTLGMPLDAFGAGAPPTSPPDAPSIESRPAAGADPTPIGGPLAFGGPPPVEPSALGAPPQPRTNRESVQPGPPPMPADAVPAPPQPMADDWPTLAPMPAAPASAKPLVPGGPVPPGGAGVFGVGLTSQGLPGVSQDPDGSDGGASPIFEEIASAWFREKRPLPVDWDAGDAGEAVEAESAQASVAAPAARATARLGQAQPATQQQASQQPATQRPAKQQPAGRPPSRPAPTGVPQPAEPLAARTQQAEQAAPAEQSTAAPPRQESRRAAPTQAEPHPATPPSRSKPAARQPVEPPARPAQPAEPAPAAAQAAASARAVVPEAPALPELTEAPAARSALSAHAGPLAKPSQPAATPEPEQQPASPSLSSVQPVELQRPERPSEPAVTAASSREFAGPADAGWQAAEVLAGFTAADEAEEVTAAGLPKRKPRARLIPGSAAPSRPAATVRSSRTAEQVRGRLARYQAGIRQGREERLRRPQDPPAAATSGRPEAHDEEHR